MNIEIPKNFPAPRKRSVIVKQVVQGTIETESGIILTDAIAKNANKPNIGVIYGIGEDCPNDIKVGDRVYYNQYADLEVLINGVPFVMMNEQEIFCILADENRVNVPVKDAREVRLIKKHAEQEAFYDRKHKIEQNAKDKKEQTIKKIIKKR